MKLKLNKSLRRALYSVMLAVSASTTTLGAASLLLGHFVSYNLQAQSNLGYTGSSDKAAPSELNWGNGAETVFTSEGEAAAYSPNANVTFAADTHTQATLQDTIIADTVSPEQGELH